MAIIGGVSTAYAQGLVVPTIARQNAVTSAHGMTTLANYINHVASKRVHILAQGGNSIGNYPPSGLIIGGYFHTSPGCKRVEGLMVAGRSTSGSQLGASNWAINASALATMYTAGSISGTSGPSDLSILRMRLTSGGADLVGDTTYQWTLTTGSVPIAVPYFLIYEVPADVIDTSTDVGVPLDVFQVNAPILDRDIADVTNTLWTLHSRGGVPHFNFAHVASTAPTANATFKNILDASTADYSSTAAGYWTIPYRKNRFGSTTLDVLLWCTSSVAAGSDGQVKFTNAAGTIGMITGISTANLYTTTATIDASTSGNQLVVVEHKSAASTITTIAAGIYELI